MKIIDIYYGKEAAGVEWFQRVKAYVKRGMSLMTTAKDLRAGRAFLALHYGLDTRWIWGEGQESIGTLNFHREVATSEHSLNVVLHNGLHREPISDQNLCFLLGYYCPRLDKYGNIEFDDNGLIIYDYDYTALTKYLSGLKPYAEYTMLTFLSDAECKLAKHFKFVWDL